MPGSAEAKNKTRNLEPRWEILAATYVRLADQSKKKNDDTGTYLDPLMSLANRMALKFDLILNLNLQPHLCGLNQLHGKTAAGRSFCS